MKEIKSILGLVVIIIGAFVLYKILPAYYGNFRLGRMIEQQAVYYTYQKVSDDEIAAAIADKAHALDVQLTPEQVKVVHAPSELQITAEYSVHVDMPIYPLDLNFKAATKNHDVMAK
jgi:hypothetical protein